MSLTTKCALLGGGAKTHNGNLDHCHHEFKTNSTDRNENATMPNTFLLGRTNARSRAKAFNWWHVRNHAHQHGFHTEISVQPFKCEKLTIATSQMDFTSLQIDWISLNKRPQHMGADPKQYRFQWQTTKANESRTQQNYGFHSTKDTSDWEPTPKTMDFMQQTTPTNWSRPQGHPQDTPKEPQDAPVTDFGGWLVEFRTHPALGRTIPWPSTRGTRNHSLSTGHIPTMSTFPLLFTGVSVCHSLDIWWIAAALGKNMTA